MNAESADKVTCDGCSRHGRRRSVGSHMAPALVETGRDVVVLDNLATGRRELVPGAARLVVGDVADSALVLRLFATHRIDAPGGGLTRRAVRRLEIAVRRGDSRKSVPEE